ncbi:MAG: AmpG family muropeptide MFS transporter [Bacteriovoracaceae bacterium]|nr:AmpG family muropeptide MFS transporter [Bacteriovoracaceae bacterium]
MKVFFSRKMFITFLMGISSGLPLLLMGSTFQAWMKESEVELSTIGLFALVGLPYTLKPLWAPLLDRFTFSFLGRRRGWIFSFQVALSISFFIFGQLDPMNNLWLMGLLALIIAFFSASQDIVIDAFRRESLADNELGLGSSLYVSGYRVAILVSGAFALYISESLSWSIVYGIMGAIMAVLTLASLFAQTEDSTIVPPKSIKEAIIGPLKEFFTRGGLRDSIIMLAFILLYKMGDQMAAHMTVPFILDLGFSKTDYAAYVKVYGIISMLVGGILGGILMVRLSITRALWIFGFFQAISTLGFSYLAFSGQDYMVLAIVVAFENIASGLGTTAYSAYMASITNKKFTATQYALLTSIMGVPRVFAAAPTGFMAEAFGWNMFFVICTLIAIPGMLLIFKISKVSQKV